METSDFFPAVLDRHTQANPTKTALEFLDPPLQQVTYQDLDRLVRRTSAFLDALEVRAGDRLALQLPKCLEFIALHLSALRLGVITLPLNPAYPPDELLYFLEDSGARFFVTDSTRADELAPHLQRLSNLEQVVSIDPDQPDDFADRLPDAPRTAPAWSYRPQHADTALMIYTSGTTGRPKGAQITYGNLASNLAALHQAWGWRQDDLLLHALPIFHVHGLVVALHGALYAGATALLIRRFDPQAVLEHLVARHCSVFMAVPTIYQRILALSEAPAYDLTHMRLLTSGSDRLPEETFQAFQRTFGHTLLERYGMTETGMNLSNPLDGERRMGSVGLPLPGVQARVVDPDTEQELPDGQVGEVQVRGPNVFAGYWGQPEQTRDGFTPDGWLRTGDLGFRDPDGYFTLQGRAKDLIITGGLNVYPPEVERVLAEHPDLDGGAVIGCPDPEWGERVVAVVVPRPGAQLAADEIIQFCRERLAAYKIPREVRIVEALPRNAMGKIQKAALRERFCP